MIGQYRVRYGDNQYTKVNTVNMVPVNTADPEANPEDINIQHPHRGYRGGHRFDTTTYGVSPCPITWFPFPGTDHPDTYPLPWSDQDKESDLL